MSSSIGDITWDEVAFWQIATSGLWPRLAAASGFPMTDAAFVPMTGKTEKIKISFPPNMNAYNSANKDISLTAMKQAEGIREYCETYFTLLEDHQELKDRVTALEGTVADLQSTLTAHMSGRVRSEDIDSTSATGPTQGVHRGVIGAVE